MRIGIDIDGVTADIAEEILYRLRQDGHEIPPDFQFSQFEIAKQFGVSKDWIGSQFADPTFWLNAKPFEDAWLTVNKWFDQNHDIFFITCRWAQNRPETERWLDEWDFPYNHVFMGMEHNEKYKVMQEHDIPIIIEDRSSEVEAVANAGLKAIQMLRTWNDPVDSPNVVCVKDFYEIDRLVQDGKI